MPNHFLTWAAMAACALVLPAQSTFAVAGQTSSAQGLAEGSANFVFSGWEGPALTVWTYVPAGVDKATAPIAIIMHGANRNADDYRDAWADEAEKGGFIVVAPSFPKDDFPGARSYNMGGVLDQTGNPRPRSSWSFSAIEPLFDDVVARLGGHQTHYTIYGHSAGSQFVHRFLFFMPDTRAKRFMAANAGWYTFVEFETAFPFGLDGTPVNEDRLRDILAKDLVVLLGDRDTDSDHRLLNRSREAMRQGRHRFARGQAFYESARKLAKEKGWAFGWSLREVEGVVHSNSGMAEGSWDLIE